MEPQGAERTRRLEGLIASLQVDARPLPRQRLPARQTSFVGRAMELAELGELLVAPACRLLTIIGPGGIGKTSLALEAAAAVRETFADGAAFVSLQAVGEPEALALALAAALGCPLTGRGGVREQLARHLRAARLLLVLDNFEHLLDEAPWLGELLAGAPGLCLLVTSREALNLREEWRYPLAGLAVPAEGDDDPAGSEAARLFAERARQVRRDFALDAERAGVARLCRLTEGLPLALELAAAWTKTLPCAVIADELERNLAFLATDLRNVPARHRSMQAAFDHSWALLAEEERAAFRRLAVFRGGFRRDAAEHVSGATLPLLAALVDKSLLRAEADGRFQLHELLRQYAAERLRAAPDEAAATHAAHRDCYLGFVADRFGPITGGGQREAVAAIAAELDNVRAAWRSAVAAGDVAALGRAAHPLSLFHDFRARYREGLALLEEGLRIIRAAERSGVAERILAAVLVDVARFHHRLGQLPLMRVALAESEECYARLGCFPPPGQMTDPRVWRGILALIDGHYDEAARIGAEAVRTNTAEGRPGNLPVAWWVRATAALWQEDPEAAGEYARRSSEAALAVGDRWHLAYSHNQQGHVAAALGDLAAARRHYEVSYTIREEFGDPEGMGTSLVHQARIAILQGERAEAEQLCRRGLAIARDIGDQVTTAMALNVLGQIACAGGDYAAAGRHLAEGIRLMVEAGFVRLLLTLLGSAGDWLRQTGRHEDAVALLTLARDHPASDHDTRARARQLIAAAGDTLAPEVDDAASARYRGADLGEVAARIVPVLTAPLPVVAAPATRPAMGGATGSSPAASALVEPLTTRELAVLRLIAVGRSNREIADELFLTENTIRSYNQQIYGKLGVGSRTRAVARARELGLLV